MIPETIATTRFTLENSLPINHVRTYIHIQLGHKKLCTVHLVAAGALNNVDEIEMEKNDTLDFEVIDLFEHNHEHKYKKEQINF